MYFVKQYLLISQVLCNLHLSFNIKQFNMAKSYNGQTFCQMLVNKHQIQQLARELKQSKDKRTEFYKLCGEPISYNFIYKLIAVADGKSELNLDSRVLDKLRKLCTALKVKSCNIITPLYKI